MDKERRTFGSLEFETVWDDKEKKWGPLVICHEGYPLRQLSLKDAVNLGWWLVSLDGDN